MCGIFGVLMADRTRTPDAAVLRAMGDVIRHRGPDDEGFFVSRGIGLGMRRLSIIDLKTGHQPIGSEDGRLQVVFNGEIYNYRQLTHELLDRGHSFATTSDTEVLVHLFEDRGRHCVERLRGMFAFALWDARAGRLVLARDRLGIKPLYYAETPAGLVFGSELKSILRVPGFERTVDVEALCAYLRYGYVPDPLSIFRRVRKLPPGHVLVAAPGTAPEVHAYWDPVPFFEASRQAPGAWRPEELRERLADSVRSHLVSDVPLGAFLSGGIDSSAVVALMAAELGRSVKTFSIGFAEPSFNELPWARLVSARFATEHHELVVEPQSLDLLARIVEHFDEPFADPSAIPTYFVSRLAREHVKVVLSGDGGDELFAGYDRYVVDRRRRGWDALSRVGAGSLVRRLSDTLPEGTRGKNYLFNVSLPRTERYLDSVSHFRPAAVRRLVSTDVLGGLPEVEDALAPHVARGATLGFPSRLQYLDLKSYLPGDILTKVDRMSMAHSIEARVPLLDHELVEFAAALPPGQRLRGTATKYLLKRALTDLVPREVLFRSKQGFAVPIAAWFRDGLGGYLHDHLLADGALAHGLLRRPAVESLFALYRETARPEYLQRLWCLLVFELWHRAFVATRP
ncbi:MAG: asparagine synthase (glutamine-hydrolyzing) [Candidatus Rokubacteria bacterium]|nr:asparagine synthase (glutamine-hydrolyzing) [Candidatus Rokubacteria bacterium]